MKIGKKLLFESAHFATLTHEIYVLKEAQKGVIFQSFKLNLFLKKIFERLFEGFTPFSIEKEPS